KVCTSRGWNTSGYLRIAMSPEINRLREAYDQHVPWRKWGPYLAERQWGAVRENYSQTAPPGTISPMTMLAHASIAGVRMSSAVFATISRRSTHTYPYDELVVTNWQRSRTELEYDLIDTGVFDQN